MWRTALAYSRRQTFLTAVVALVAFTIGPLPAGAHDDDRVLRNGGFEAGTLAGWRSSESGQGRWSAASGTTSPVSGSEVPAPPQGRWQAVSDQLGPGSHILYRDIVVDDDELGLVMTLWYRNQNGAFFTPRTLDEASQPNQQLRVDIMRRCAPLRSMAPGDILATIFRTRVGDPTSLAPRVLRQNLSRFEDRTVRLRIAEVDNLFFFQAGVDGVRLVELDDDDSGSVWPDRHGAVSGGEAPSAARFATRQRY